jgi:hypothetical protein
MTVRKTFFLRYISLIVVFILFIVALTVIKAKAEELSIIVTIDHTKIDADLADFPVVLKLNDANAQDFFDRIVSNPGQCAGFF